MAKSDKDLLGESVVEENVAVDSIEADNVANAEIFTRDYSQMTIEYIPRTQIQAVDNFRKFESEEIKKHIATLHDDIAEHEIREPLKVRVLEEITEESGETKKIYSIVDGECRFRATEGLEKFADLPCIVMEERDADTWRICANILRKDFTWCELSDALVQYKKIHGDANGEMTNEDLARAFGHKANWARDILALQNLPTEIKEKELLKPTLPLRELRLFANKDCQKNPKKAVSKYNTKVTREDKKTEADDNSNATPKISFTKTDRGNPKERHIESVNSTFASFVSELEKIKLELPENKYANTEPEDFEKKTKSELGKMFFDNYELAGSIKKCKASMEKILANIAILLELLPNVKTLVDDEQAKATKDYEKVKNQHKLIKERLNIPNLPSVE